MHDIISETRIGGGGGLCNIVSTFCLENVNKMQALFK